MATRDGILRDVFQQGVDARRKDLPRDAGRGLAGPVLTGEWLKGWDSEDIAMRNEAADVPAGELMRGNVLRTGIKRRGISPFPERAEPDDFVPSSDDRKASEETGNPVRVSVFDRARTTVPQCRQIRGASPAVPVFDLSVKKIRSIEIPGQSRFLRVVDDPLPIPGNLLPGAGGHCGIEGLERPGGCPKQEYRALLSQLVDVAIPAT